MKSKINIFLAVSVVPGCTFIKHRLHGKNTPQVQIYYQGEYLHRVHIVHINEALETF